MAEYNPNEESPGGHEMWPVGADEVLVFREDGPRNTVTLYFDTVNGIVTTTLNADNLGTEDMFRSQDPTLCAPGPSDPREDLSETPDLVCSEDEVGGPSSTGPNDPQEESEVLDSDETPSLDLHASMELANELLDSYETPHIDLHASMELPSELFDSDETPSISLLASMELPNTLFDSDETPDIDLHASMEIISEEDDGPEPTNRMCDHPTPPELKSGPGARNKEVGTPARTTDLDCDSKSNYDHLTSSSDDEDENLTILQSDYGEVLPSRLCEYRKRLTPAEIISQDFIYEDVAPTVSGVRRKQYCTTATTTDSDSDVDYTEFPLNSKNHKLSNGQNDFTCLICKKRFCKVESLKTHVYWHAMEPQEEPQSDTSEDVPILSSGSENDCDYELFRVSRGHIVGNAPVPYLKLKDFIAVYGEENMERNQEYVTDFLNELHQRQNELEQDTHDPQISDVEDISDVEHISDEPHTSDVEDKNDNTTE